MHRLQVCNPFQSARRSSCASVPWAASIAGGFARAVHLMNCPGCTMWLRIAVVEFNGFNGNSDQTWRNHWIQWLEIIMSSDDGMSWQEMATYSKSYGTCFKQSATSARAGDGEDEPGLAHPQAAKVHWGLRQRHSTAEATAKAKSARTHLRLPKCQAPEFQIYITSMSTIYIYVCMYVRTYVCMYACTYVCMYVCM